MGNSLSLPLVINTYLIGRYFETRQILFPIKTSPTNFSTQRSLLPEPVVAMMPIKWWFSKSICTMVECCLPSLFAYLHFYSLNYLSVPVWTHGFLLLWVTFILQVISSLILLSCSNCPRHSHWKTLQLGSYIFSIKSHHFSTLPYSPIQKDSLGLSHSFPAPALQSVQGVLVFTGEYLKNKIFGS